MCMVLMGCGLHGGSACGPIGAVTAADDSTPAAPGDLHGFRDPAKKTVWIGMAIGIVLLAAALVAKPVNRWFKERRGTRLAQEAGRLIDEGQFAAAARRVQLALLLAPKNLAVLRATARMCTGLGQVEGLNYWQMLAAEQPLSRADQIAYARLALEWDRTDLARPVVIEFLKEDRGNPVTLELVLHLMERSERRGAIEIAKALMPLYPTDELVLVRAAHVLTDSADAAVRESGLRQLWSVALGAGTNKVEAAYRLSRLGELRKPELEMLVRSLSEIASPTLGVTLLRHDLTIRASDAARASVVAEVVSLGGPGATQEARGAVARWLLEHREPERALDVLPFDSVREVAGLVQLHLQALADLERWQEVGQVLDQPDLKLDPVMWHCFKAVSDTRAGKRESAGAHFNNALAASKSRLEPLRLVATYAELVGSAEVAIDAWRQVMGNPEHALEGARAIARLARHLPEYQAALSAVKRLLEFEPEDAAVLKEFAYLSLILDTRDPKAAAAARTRFTAEPNDMEWRAIAALAEHRAGNPAAALELVESKRPDWKAASQRFRLVCTAVLGANNLRSDARDLARGIEVERLKPQERDLIRAWMN